MTWLSGVIKTWNEDRGFGFVKPHGGGQDVFLHVAELPKGSRPQAGETVFFHLTEGKEGKLRACDAYLQGQRPQAGNSAKLGLFNIVLMAMPFLLSFALFHKTGNTIPGLAYATMSFLAIITYSVDKRRALDQKWRIPESLLHSIEVLGGWPGALVAQKQLNHKTKKTSYQVAFWLILIFHSLAWISYYLAGDLIMQKLTVITGSTPYSAIIKPTSETPHGIKLSQPHEKKKSH